MFFHAPSRKLERWSGSLNLKPRRRIIYPVRIRALRVQTRPAGDATINDAVALFIVAPDGAGFCFWPANYKDVAQFA
jgi:hypothetical protein